MMKYIFYTLLLYTITYTDNKPAHDNLNNDVIQIDIDALYNDDEKLYSELFSDFKLVFLESKPDYMIGMINQVRVFDGHIYVLDARMSKSLFVFDMDGKIVRKIGRQGRGPGEYQDISSFRIDPKTHFIHILDEVGRKIHGYTQEGEFVKSIDISPQHIPLDFIVHNDVIIHDIDLRRYGKDKHLLYNLADGSKHLPTSVYGKSWKEGYVRNESFCEYSDGVTFHKPYLDTIYNIIDGKVIPSISLTAKDMLTEDDLTEYNNAMPPAGLMSSKKLWGPQTYIENDDLIFFEIRYKDAAPIILISKRTQNASLVQFEDFKDDMAFSPSRTIMFVGHTDRAYIKSIDPMELTEVQKGLLVEGSPLNKEDYEKLKSRTMNDNPILVFYTTKNQK